MTVTSSPIPMVVTASRQAAVGAIDDNAGNWTHYVPANTPRISGKGHLLVEESRTNFCYSNINSGAAPGFPGTINANWYTSPEGTIGLNRQIVGTGIENGIDYTDIRWFGTSTGGKLIFVSPVGQLGDTASNGQTWAFSYYMKRVAGVFDNINSWNYRTFESNSSLVLLATQDGPPLDVTALGNPSVRLTDNRLTYIRACNQPTCNKVSCCLVIDCATGPVDLTIRFGLPQHEIGAFPTSPIRNTGGAQVRAAEVISINNGPWLNQTAGTWVIDCSIDASIANQSCPISFSDNSTNNRMLYLPTGPNRFRFVIYAAAVNQAQLDPPAPFPQGTFGKSGSSYAANSAVNYYNGGTIMSDDVVTVPTGLNTIKFTAQTVNPAGVYRIRRVTYWPFRVDNRLLQSLSKP